MPTAPRPARWVAPVNALLAAGKPVIRAATRFEAVERAARRRAHGDPDEAFRADMRILHDQLQAAPGLTGIGRLALRSEVARRMANRSKVRRLLASRPEIAGVPIDRPVFITGLPRTGTSLLHGMLAQHSGARAPLLWELMHPAATGAEAAWRLRSTQALTAMYYAMVPAMRTIHPLSATEPEECVFLLPQNGYYLTRAPMPAYARWCAGRDSTGDYAYLKQQLQVLQATRTGPPGRWVLKSPFHLGNTDALRSVFPDAAIVVTRRDPVTALASWCSFCEATRGMHSNRVDLAELGRSWLEFWVAAARRAGSPAVTVEYDDLVAGPAAVTEKLWQSLGAAVSDADRRAFETSARRDRRRRPGGHRYSIERYGLSPEQVEQAFDGTYVSRPA